MTIYIEFSHSKWWFSIVFCMFYQCDRLFLVRCGHEFPDFPRPRWKLRWTQLEHRRGDDTELAADCGIFPVESFRILLIKTWNFRVTEFLFFVRCSTLLWVMCDFSTFLWVNIIFCGQTPFCCFGSTIEWDWREIQAPLKHEPWDHGSSCFCFTPATTLLSPNLKGWETHDMFFCLKNDFDANLTFRVDLYGKHVNGTHRYITLHCITLHYITLHYPLRRWARPFFHVPCPVYIPLFLLVKYPAFNAALPLHTYEPIQLTVDSH